MLRVAGIAILSEQDPWQPLRAIPACAYPDSFRLQAEGLKSGEPALQQRNPILYILHTRRIHRDVPPDVSLQQDAA